MAVLVVGMVAGFLLLGRILSLSADGMGSRMKFG